MSDATLPEEPTSGPSTPAAKSQLSLCVIWAPGEGHLLGSSLLPLRSPGVFGRGTDDPGGHPRLLLAWRRPGPTLRPDPPANAKLSRNQLLLRASPSPSLLVENTGLCPMIYGGREVKTCEVFPGEVLLLGHQLAFLCLLQPAPLDAPPAPGAFAPGEADPAGIVGESAAIWELRRSLHFASQRGEHALIQGPSGSGKELVASALHRQSPRASRPLVSRNAATIPEGLVDAELFGNAKNYPNPGMAERPGLIGQADGGTLFLDEFAELPHGVQAHLLRVLDAGDYQRLGEATGRRSDFRLVAATNRPIEALKHDVAARFVLRLRVPDLNERRDDIPLLARHLLRRIAARDPDAVRRFFPGGDPATEPRVGRELVLALVQRSYATHVRELLALLWESIQHSPGDTLLAPPGLAPSGSRPSVPPVSAPGEAPGDPDGDATLTPERIQRALDEHNGAIEKTWKALGLPSRFVLRRLIQKHGLEVRKSLRPPSR